MKNILFKIMILAVVVSCSAHEDGEHGHENDHADEHEHEHGNEHGHEDEKNIGEGKAILNYSEAKGVQLSDSVIERFNIEHVEIITKNQSIPETAFIFNAGERGYYRKRNNHYKFIRTDSKEDSKTELIVGDFVATKNINIINISDYFSHDKSSYGHSH